MGIRHQARRQARNDGAPPGISTAAYTSSPTWHSPCICCVGDLFLDVGVLASGVCGARSMAFEPDPHAADALQRNVTINGLNDLVTLHRKAVGIDGEVRFTIGLDTVNHVVGIDETDTRVVPSVSLDSLDRRPTLIKLDVEGGEDDVIRNGRGTLSRAQAIIIETVSDESHAALSEAGFMRVYYAPFKRLLSAASPVPTVPISNSLYVKNFDCDQAHRERTSRYCPWTIDLRPCHQVFNKSRS